MPGPDADQEPAPDMDALGDPERWGEAGSLGEALEHNDDAARALRDLSRSPARVSDLPGGPTGQAIALSRAARELLQAADPGKPHYDAVCDLGQKLLEAAEEKIVLARHSNGWPPIPKLRALAEGGLDVVSDPNDIEPVVTRWLMPNGVAELLAFVDTDSVHHLLEEEEREKMRVALRGLGRRAVRELVVQDRLRAEDVEVALEFEEPS